MALRISAFQCSWCCMCSADASCEELACCLHMKDQLPTVRDSAVNSTRPRTNFERGLALCLALHMTASCESWRVTGSHAQRQRTATQALTGTGASTAANGASSGAWTPSAPSRSCVGRFGGRLVPQPGATGLGFSGPSATAMAAQP